ncbi:TetR family transcriptional regulator [Actinocatenispora thailandica]|uniref:TetR family transcriptional regulator n=1 Tax=Actinocatenispora thailandica TaxID=227318 RepID=A0A7R7DMI7_9ACTN|nr:TetR/AcrR family transcriptional regulator [Actinocatenispora thailandica]BCJ34410.1 TetR family transcriptional regulator [Actinocatenispora thailandica]
MPTQRLTPEQITAAALDLMDAEGLAAVSMRALAQRLGVGTMTLYGYYRSRDELLDAVVDAATADAANHRTSGRTSAKPLAELTALFTALHRTLSEHPALYRIRMSRPFLSPGVLRVCDRALGQLRRAGLDDAAAVRGYRTLYLFTLGCVTYASQDAAGTRSALDALPPSDFPHLSALAPTMAHTAGGPDEFDTGLATLLTALLGQHG